MENIGGDHEQYGGRRDAEPFRPHPVGCSGERTGQQRDGEPSLHPGAPGRRGGSQEERRVEALRLDVGREDGRVGVERQHPRAEGGGAAIESVGEERE